MFSWKLLSTVNLSVSWKHDTNDTFDNTRWKQIKKDRSHSIKLLALRCIVFCVVANNPITWQIKTYLLFYTISSLNENYNETPKCFSLFSSFKLFVSAVIHFFSSLISIQLQMIFYFSSVITALVLYDILVEQS